MGRMIDEIRIRENQMSVTSLESSPERFGPDPRITIPASGLAEEPHTKALHKTALDHLSSDQDPSCATGGNHTSG